MLTTMVPAARTTASGIAAIGFPPSPDAFTYPSLGGGDGWFTKPVLLVVLSVVIVGVFFAVAARPAAIVPGKLQFFGESAYGFVRNSIARDLLGSKDFRTWTPFLFTLFFFVLVNNVFGIVPFLQFPTMSRVGIPYGLAALVWVLYIAVGIRRKGPWGYLKATVVPPNVPWYLLIILVPLEFLSNLIVRPVTLSLRLFANMFAGHLLLLVFTIGGEVLVFEHDGGALGRIGYGAVGVLSWVMAILFTFFEALIEVLQAYIFTLLAGVYIAGSLSDEH